MQITFKNRMLGKQNVHIYRKFCLKEFNLFHTAKGTIGHLHVELRTARVRRDCSFIGYGLVWSKVRAPKCLYMGYKCSLAYIVGASAG